MRVRDANGALEFGVIDVRNKQTDHDKDCKVAANGEVRCTVGLTLRDHESGVFEQALTIPHTGNSHLPRLE